jgi:hypothetical protein
VPEGRSPARGRRAASPPREILTGQVRTEDLPDVARPGASASPQQDTTVDPAVGASGNAVLATELARSVVEAGRLPLQLAEAALEIQARAIDDGIARGAVPAVLVPGAAVLRAQIGFLIGMIRSVSGSAPSGP